jgi:hypothetical protein
VGTLRRAIHAARYLSDPAYRRKIGRQLNKGESLHALRRDLHYAHQGTVGKPHLAEQSEQAWCLTVLTNSVITWTTEYYQLAVQQLRGQGRDVPDEILAHVSPAHSENVNFFGVITVDVEAELAKLDPAGWRPLRPAAPDLSLRCDRPGPRLAEPAAAAGRGAGCRSPRVAQGKEAGGMTEQHRPRMRSLMTSATRMKAVWSSSRSAPGRRRAGGCGS